MTAHGTSALTVGVDLDGVLALLYPSLQVRYARLRGLRVDQVPMPDDWHLACWGLAAAEIEELLVDVVDSGELRTLPPDTGAVDALRRATDDGHQIVVVTARGQHRTRRDERADTRWWLDRLRLDVHDVVFTTDKTTADVDVLLDDCPANINAFAATGRPAWLVDRPWNQQHNGRRYVAPHGRLTDWYDLRWRLRDLLP